MISKWFNKACNSLAARPTNKENGMSIFIHFSCLCHLALVACRLTRNVLYLVKEKGKLVLYAICIGCDKLINIRMWLEEGLLRK